MHRIARSRGFPHNSLESCVSYPMPNLLKSCHGEHGHEAATKEKDQLHQQNCFTLISVKDMTPTERRKAMGVLMFLTEKRDKSVKG